MQGQQYGIIIKKITSQPVNVEKGFPLLGHSMMRRGAGISVCVWAQTQQREWRALCSLFLPLYGLLALARFLYFLQTRQAHSRPQVFATCSSISINPFLLSKSQGKIIHPLDMHLLSILRSPFQTSSPSPTIAFLPSACWVSLHCGMGHSSVCTILHFLKKV